MTISSSSPTSVALRTYVLALSFSTIPALLPSLLASLSRKQGSLRHSSSSHRSLFYVLKRELGPTGLPFAMAIAAGGGKWLCNYFDNQFDTISQGKAEAEENPRSRWHRRSSLFSYMLSSFVAIHLLHARRRALKIAPYPLTFPIGAQSGSDRASPTLDMTLLLLVRAIDAAVGSILNSKSKPIEVARWRSSSDAFVFWLSCSRYVHSGEVHHALLISNFKYNVVFLLRTTKVAE